MWVRCSSSWEKENFMSTEVEAWGSWNSFLPPSLSFVKQGMDRLRELNYVSLTNSPKCPSIPLKSPRGYSVEYRSQKCTVSQMMLVTLLGLHAVWGWQSKHLLWAGCFLRAAFPNATQPPWILISSLVDAPHVALLVAKQGSFVDCDSILRKGVWISSVVWFCFSFAPLACWMCWKCPVCFLLVASSPMSVDVSIVMNCVAITICGVLNAYDECCALSGCCWGCGEPVTDLVAGSLAWWTLECL